MTELVPLTLVSGGDVANYYASQSVFGDYLRTLTPASLRAFTSDIGHWAAFLVAGQMIDSADRATQFMNDAQAWAG